MRSLDSIAELQPDERELLEAAGFPDVAHLASANPEALFDELVRANALLRIVPANPDRQRVGLWIELANGRRPAAVPVEEADAPPGPAKKRAAKKVAAKKATKKAVRKTAAKKTARKGAKVADPGESAPELEFSDCDAASAPHPGEGGPDLPGDGGTVAEPVSGSEANEAVDVTDAATELEGQVNFEADPDVQDMLQRSPLALPLPARLLAERGIAPAAIAEAPLLNRAQGDIEVRVTTGASRQRTRSAPSTPRVRHGGLVHVADSRREIRKGIDLTRIRQIDSPPAIAVPEVPALPEGSRIQVLRTAREETNRGKDPRSRRYVRGVLHDRGVMVAFGSLFALLLLLVIPLSVVSAVLLLLSDLKPDEFGWVSKWVLVFPALLPVLGILYLTVSTRVKCRVCGQKVLVPRHCLKHVKAHHVPGLGYIAPLAAHVLFFRWFNCTFCGTAIRTKE